MMAPALKDRAVSMLRLDEFNKLILQAGVSHTVSNQCDFGTRTETFTSWISHGICLDKFNGPCTHPKRWVVSNRTKRWKLAKHETHKGDEKFTFAHKNDNEQALPHPASINEYIANQLCTDPPPTTTAIVPSTIPSSKNNELWEQRAGKETVAFSQHLRGGSAPLQRDLENKTAIGGLRDAHSSLLKLPQTARFGRVIGTQLMKCMLDQQAASNARGGGASWISQTNKLVGIEEKGQVAPAQAVE